MNQTVEANSGQDEIEPIRPELSEPSRMSAFWTPDDACVPSHRLETRTWDLFAALAWAERPDPLSRLRDALQAQTSRQRILFAPSGRCAIARILSLLPQQEVVMPAFLCHEVRKAAEIAGKRIIYVDTAKNGINATSAEFAEAAKPGRVLLAVHALGIPTDIESICELARRRDCVVIEDAAAAFGGRRNGRVLGTFGNIGIFSFERSKRFAAFRGAAIVINDDRILDLEKLQVCTETGLERSMPIGELIQALAQNLATSRWIYRRFTLPVLPLRDLLLHLLRRFHKGRVTVNANNQAEVPPNAFYNQQFHPYQAELVLRLVKRMDQIREQIACLAEIYLKAHPKDSRCNIPAARIRQWGTDEVSCCVSGKAQGKHPASCPEAEAVLESAVGPSPGGKTRASAVSERCLGSSKRGDASPLLRTVSKVR